MGYHRAGFRVIGVDIIPQPRYPFEFHQADALSWRLDEADVVAASPTCKTHTDLKVFSADYHRDIIPELRAKLVQSGLPYVIENVEGAPLQDPVMLCGSMFDLLVERHRLFESNVPLSQMPCRHDEQARVSPGFPVNVYDKRRRRAYMSPTVSIHGGGQGVPVATQRRVMGIDWMMRDELSQAIPPAYTRWIGARLMAWLARSGGWSR